MITATTPSPDAEQSRGLRRVRGSLGFQQHVLRDHQRQHRIEKVTNLTDESMGLCVLCEITIPRIAIKKNPQLTQQTVNRLKEAFWKLYETKPIEKISVRQITELAGYNHATFYLYFSSVRDVRDQIEDDLIAQRDLILKQCMHDGTLEIGQVISSLATMLMPYGHVLLGPNGDPAFIVRAEETAWPFLQPILFPSIAPHMQMPSQSEAAQQPAASPQAQ